MKSVTLILSFIGLVIFNRPSVASASPSSSNNHPTCQMQLECVGPTRSGTSQVRIPIRSARGPPGPKGDTGQKGEQGIKGDVGPIPKTTQHRVAFFAGLSESIQEQPLNKNCELIFNNVKINVGSGYSNGTGKFTAPVAGVYIFTVVISAQAYHKAGVELLHNGSPALHAWCESTYWATVTNQAILELKRNDQVWLQCRDQAFQLHGFNYSSLSGYLLYSSDDDKD